MAITPSAPYGSVSSGGMHKWRVKMSRRKSNLKVATAHGHRFPTKFNIYRVSRAPTEYAPPDYVLGEHQEQPLYSFNGSRRRVNSREGMDVYLLDGILAYSRILAYARYEPGQHMEKWTVHLGPPREQVPGTDFTVIKDENSLIFRFSIKTDVANSVEDFEWRAAGYPDIAPIFRIRNASSWELVRMANDALTDLSALTSDGREKIGMLQRLNKRRKRWRFEFLGTGTSRPLGQQWELAAIITMVTLTDYLDSRKL
ncbi:hypothetical protein DL764_003502 [Monosporascus ibericus]|uniref:Uncharacterized protein n=1 Tax=Monosporascus ibericus TaxID=155417 RepID=A0A4Q4TGB5_9PEZI|nr:hypothetical protein DL764_003502 [Monosporascus ibericus]